MGTGTSTSLLLNDFQDLPTTAQEHLRHEYEICLGDGMEEEEVFYSLERSLIDEVQSRLQALRVYSQQTSHPEGTTTDGGSVGSHDSMSSIGQQSTSNTNKYPPKQRSKFHKIPGRSRQSKSPFPSSEVSHGLFPPLPTSPQSRTIPNKPITNTTNNGPPRYWEGEYLNEIEEDASYLEDTINRRVNTLRNKNERLLQKITTTNTTTTGMHSQPHYTGDRTNSNNPHPHHNYSRNHITSDVQSLVSNGNSTHNAASSVTINYSISPLKPHLHPYDQGIGCDSFLCPFLARNLCSSYSMYSHNVALVSNH